MSDQQKFLRSGLSKLAEAEETVDSLSQGADKQRALLKVKQAEAEQALGYIQESMMKVVGGDALYSRTSYALPGGAAFIIVALVAPSYLLASPFWAADCRKYQTAPPNPSIPPGR